jgi:plasmid stabilization system protein ParE
MAKLRFTNNAVNDLSEIWDYTTKVWSKSKRRNIIKLSLTLVLK